MPDVDLTWDEMAFLLALIRKPPLKLKMELALRRRFIYAMTRYDGNTSNRMSPDIEKRVEYWRTFLRRLKRR